MSGAPSASKRDQAGTTVEGLQDEAETTKLKEAETEAGEASVAKGPRDHGTSDSHGPQ